MATTVIDIIGTCPVCSLSKRSERTKSPGHVHISLLVEGPKPVVEAPCVINRAVGSKNELVRPYSHFETLVQLASSCRSGGESGAVAIIMAGSVLDHHSIVLCHHAHNWQVAISACAKQ